MSAITQDHGAWKWQDLATPSAHRSLLVHKIWLRAHVSFISGVYVGLARSQSRLSQDH